MKILVTGANGFVGRKLAERLLAETDPALRPTRLVLGDMRFETPFADPRVETVAGSIAEPDILKRAVAGGIDLLFHLATIPGGAAEADFELGRQVNLDGTIALFDAMRAQGIATGKPPRIVFTSSIAVFGPPLPALVDDDTPTFPALSYGAHKLMAEILLADYARKGWIDARSIRLPGALARPRQPSGMMSAFMSDIMHALKAGERFTCPVSAGATNWYMSMPRVVENLIHAARLPVGSLGTRRVWTLPALHLTMAEIVAALADLYGPDRAGLVTYAPDPKLEALFGSMPPLATPLADALGFKHDGDARTLVARSLALD